MDQDSEGNPVGKCSSDINEELAQDLLDSGITWSPLSHRSPLPHSVFNVYNGIPYRAHRRGSTRFYHGFPDVRSRIPRAIRDQLRDLAVAQQCADEFDAWMIQTQRYP